MSKTRIGVGIAVAVAAALGLGFLLFRFLFPGEYIPTDNEIALHVRLRTEEDIGLLVYDYRADGRAFSGGISNADRSPIGRDSENVIVWEREALGSAADTVDLRIQFRIITEYVDPNFENIYPEDITRYINPISWEAHFGESRHLTITGSRADGYRAVWSD